MYVYYSKLKNFWDEFESMVVPSPACNCEKSKEFLAYLQSQKLYQFLIGLNDTYSQVKSHIILMIPLPRVNQTYSMIMNDGNQKVVAQYVSAIGLLGVAPGVESTVAM